MFPQVPKCPLPGCFCALCDMAKISGCLRPFCDALPSQNARSHPERDTFRPVPSKRRRKTSHPSHFAAQNGLFQPLCRLQRKTARPSHFPPRRRARPILAVFAPVAQTAPFQPVPFGRRRASRCRRVGAFLAASPRVTPPARSVPRSFRPSFAAARRRNARAKRPNARLTCGFQVP